MKRLNKKLEEILESNDIEWIEAILAGSEIDVSDYYTYETTIDNNIVRVQANHEKISSILAEELFIDVTWFSHDKFWIATSKDGKIGAQCEDRTIAIIKCAKEVME